MVDNEEIVIPITISTEESQEIKQLVKDLKSVEHVPETAQRKQPKFKSATGAPIKTTNAPDKTGIFAGEMEDFAFPDQARDRTSRQAIQRKNIVTETKK